MNKAVHLADGLELVDAGHYVREVRRAVLDGSKMALSPRGDGLEGLTIASPTGDVSIGADHHVTMNMYLAKTEGASLTTVDTLGALKPESGCG